MLLGEPARTQGDLNFSLFGFPIRISVWFWVAGAIMRMNGLSGAPTEMRLMILLSWLSAILVSILIHELGHSLAMRRLGIGSNIVLYHFGGLAIPDSVSGYARHPIQRIFISAAGPMLQISAAILMMVAIAASGHFVPLGGFVADILRLPQLGDVPSIPNRALNYFCFDFLYISTYWALINLLPVYPLDGGQISRELFLLKDRSNPIKNSLVLSIATGVGMAFWALQNQRTFIAILFGSLAYSSYQLLQGYTGGGTSGRSKW